MGVFFSLLFESFSCIFYGVVLTAFIMATLFFLLKGLSNGVYRSVSFYITGVILAILLSINTTVIIGAFSVKNQTESMYLWLKQQLNGMEGFADIENSQLIGEKLNDNFPMLGCFFNLFDMSGYAISELPDVFCEMINSELNSIIINKILWSVGFIVAAMLVALYFAKDKKVDVKRKSGIRPISPHRRNHRGF